MSTQWRWVERYAQQFVACDVGPGQTAVVLSETTSRPEVIDTARFALDGHPVVTEGILRDDLTEAGYHRDPGRTNE